MPLSCPSCGSEIPAADVNINLALAKCMRCSHVFNFGKELNARPITAVAAPRNVPIPTSMHIEELGNDLTLSWSWYSHALWFLLVFCIFWDSFLVMWYGILLSGSFAMKGAGWFILLPALFPLIHVAVGVGLTYAVLAGFLNRTTVRVTQGELTVRHGPVPFWGNQTISVFEVSQLYVTECVTNGRRRQSITYDVNAIRSDGTKVKLIGGLQELDRALFLEQKLEEHLKIEDERVAGEVGK